MDTACPYRQKNEGVGFKRATTSRVRRREAAMQNDQSRGLNRWERRIQRERREEEERRRKEKKKEEKKEKIGDNQSRQ